MERLTRDSLLAIGREQEEFSIPPYGTVVIQALNREEAMRIANDDKMSMIDKERHMLVAAMVDPPMDWNDVKQLQLKINSGTLEKMTNRIARMSGMLPEQPKEETKRFPDGGEPSERVLHSGEAGEDPLGDNPDQ